VLRSGAQVGDGLLLGGAVGLAAAGLATLPRDDTADLLRDPSIAACVDAWRRPRARTDLGLAMAAVATSAVDVSDGLLRDASHIAEASGVCLVLDEEALRRHAAGALEEAARLLGRDLLQLVLKGGEDYAILATSASPITGFSEVGTVAEGPPSLRLRRADGTTSALSPAGFDHFA
jgi:thiamine-monophosphate kinase